MIVTFNASLISSSLEISPNNGFKFNCTLCDYMTCNKFDWNKHIVTKKHIARTNVQLNGPPSPKKYTCSCGKIYIYSSGLSLHKKTCLLKTATKPAVSILTKDNPDAIAMLTNLVIDVVKSNIQMVECNKSLVESNKIMMDTICKNGGGAGTVNNTMTTNSHNKTFNLNVFLNEDCKDAMNLMDFVDSFELQLSDLESVGELGYIEGLSQIIIKKLNAMDIHKRPIHCSDVKRETLHIKDHNKWERETANYDKLRRAIKRISKKNSDLLLDWKAAHPNSQFSDNRHNDKYLNLIKESMGGQDISVSENKIIKKIAKQVLI